MKKILAAVLGAGVLISGFCLSAAAEGAAIGIGSAAVKPGEDVSIPIVLSGNPGIEGMELCIEYDRALTLKGYVVGDAFPTLTCTPSGKYDTYPFKFVWDGMADDRSNGTLATLTFGVPADASGTYEITAYVEDGCVYNDNCDDIAVYLTGGKITVGKSISLEDICKDGIVSFKANLSSDEEITGVAVAALYNSDEKLIEVKRSDAASEVDFSFTNVSGATMVKVFWWDSITDMTPYASYETISL